MADSSQKFIGRNRAPRVQIEYDVELYGAEKKVQLPFVMGVMSDLLGKSNTPQPAIADRKFLEIDVDNFDSRMKAMAPRAAFTVPNTLTGEGNIAIDLTFESLKDFSPGAIAAKVDSLRPLLEARTQLQNLMAYMDGKTGAEELIEKLLHNPALLSTLVQGPAASDVDQASALDSLRGAAVPEAREDDAQDDVLAALSAAAPAAQASDNSLGDALASLAANVPEEREDQKTASEADTALATLTSEASTQVAPVDESEDVLASLRDLEPAAEKSDDETADVLEGLARSGEELQVEDSSANDEILQDLAKAEVPEVAEADQVADILSGLEMVGPDSQETEDELTEVLETLEQAASQEEVAAEEGLGAILSDLAVQDGATASEEEDLAALLDDLSATESDESDSAEADLADILGNLDAGGAEADPEASARIDDILADVAASEPSATDPADEEDALADILGDLSSDEGTDAVAEDVDLQDLLGELPASDQDVAEAGAELEEVLAGLEPLDDASAVDGESAQENVLAELTRDAPFVDESEAAGEQSLEGLLADLDLDDSDPADAGDMDSILSDLEGGADTDGGSAELGGAEASLTELLGATDTAEADLDELLGTAGEKEDTSGDEFDLDDLLGDLGESASDTDTEDSDDLDDLLVGLGSDGSSEDAEEITDPDLEDDLDELLGGLENDAPSQDGQRDEPEGETCIAEPEFAYGTISADRPEAQKLVRKRFRIALLGDFSGRAARGQIETGDALAQRPGILLDPDTVEEVIAGFASDLVLPIGQNEAGIVVKLKELDDLHPDELFENVALFAELVSLRDQLQSGVTMDHASRTLAAWAQKHGTPIRFPKRSSASNTVPADRRLSAFQQLIGDRENTLREASPIEELLARVVGPHIRALPNPEVPAMQAAVDVALSDAMRLVLHHPEFQALEAQWRSLDLIARSIEVDDSLEVVLYDVSAEELAADLAAQDDLTGSGFTRLLTEEPMDPDLGRGGYSALIGMYGFEETPPHAELLGRIARVAAHVDAPFFSSLSPEFLKTAKKDRPALVASAWDTLKQMSEAGHLGLASPRFLLRRPYGAKSNPVDAFDFEEFTEGEGLRGMLWGNPVVLVAILLARSFKENGASMQLGSIMTLGSMPYHTVNDRFGDQVALPCTERNIDLDKIAMANERGVMALSAVKGRDELRLTSFSSVAGAEVLGPWSGVPAPAPSPADPREKTGVAPAQAADETQTDPSVAESDDLDLSDLGLDDLGLDDLGLEDSDQKSADAEAEEADLDDLDALLAGFAEESDSDDDAGEDEMDADLAALLADL
jgi:type VI secretion system ImpB/VipA family protein